MIESIQQQYAETRSQSAAFCAPLNTEDYALQAEAFVSPPKWHLAHTSWFFETFLLKPFLANYQALDQRYEVLFNSYYNGIGEQFPRPRRGLLSRPSVTEVMSYRAHVDAAMSELLEQPQHANREEIISRTVLGIEHERQHQELFFTDIKYSLAINPMFPAYLQAELVPNAATSALQWHSFEGRLLEAGFSGEGFCFDNELPRHKTYVGPFELANRLVTNAEYQKFVDDGAYQRAELWLADGWQTVLTEQWRAPQYWLTQDAEELEYTLHGLQPRAASAPVCHVSGYEAEAFARWAGARLPTEFEWELAAAQAPPAHGGVDSGYYHPSQASDTEGLQQLYTDCWQWTRSAYSPYPGFVTSPGAIGEYNGKFMSNQWVLRGGSCVSKSAQLRPSYRNFFYPQDRWQFSGIRLARDVAKPQ